MKEDGEIKCYLPGVPRMMYMPYPVQIVQSTEFILMMSEFATAQRTINMTTNNRPPADTWMGWSNGRWEGDTLVIDSRGFLGRRSARWTRRARSRSGSWIGPATITPTASTSSSASGGPGHHLSYEATIEDPNVYTRPWTISMPLYRRVEPNMQLGEFKCEEFVSDLVYGKYQKGSGQ